MTRRQARDIVVTAIDQLVTEEPELLHLDVSEPALCHHLARYIAALVPVALALKVDVEYNRHGADPKRLDLPGRQALDGDLRATTVFPDIIVHRRGTDACNYVVLEIKTPGEDLEYDTRTLGQFRDVPRYRHAAHVILGRTLRGDVVRDVVWQDD